MPLPLWGRRLGMVPRRRPSGLVLPLMGLSALRSGLLLARSTGLLAGGLAGLLRRWTPWRSPNGRRSVLRLRPLLR